MGMGVREGHAWDAQNHRTQLAWAWQRWQQRPKGHEEAGPTGAHPAETRFSERQAWPRWSGGAVANKGAELASDSRKMRAVLRNWSPPPPHAHTVLRRPAPLSLPSAPLSS